MPRHEHEYHLWETVKLPDGKALIPGVITHASNIVEHPELIAERLMRYANLVGRGERDRRRRLRLLLAGLLQDRGAPAGDVGQVPGDGGGRPPGEQGLVALSPIRRPPSEGFLPCCAAVATSLYCLPTFAPPPGRQPSGETLMDQISPRTRSRAEDLRPALSLGARTCRRWGTMGGRLRGARRFRPPAPLPLGRAQAGAGELRPRRAAALRRQQHPLRHRHQDRRMGARQALPLRAARQRAGADPVGFRLGRRAPPAVFAVAQAGELQGRPARHARHHAARRSG